MYTGIHHLHSALRYVILLLVCITVIRSIAGWMGKKPFTKTDDKVALFSMVFLHIQFLLGLILYFLSPKTLPGDIGAAMGDKMLRFFTVEHGVIMLAGITLVTLGKTFSKKALTDVEKHKKIALYFLAGLLLIFMGIPWPFMKEFGSWF